MVYLTDNVSLLGHHFWNLLDYLEENTASQLLLIAMESIQLSYSIKKNTMPSEFIVNPTYIMDLY